MTEYIEELKKKTKEYNELETLRYIYIDLGKRMSFDLRFSFGNIKNRLKIYYECKDDISRLEYYLENGIIICKSISYLIKYILTKMDIKTEVYIEDEPLRSYQHVYNIVTLKDGRKFKIDLQSDLENIQAHLKTEYFGKDLKENEVITECELKEADEKIEYVSETNDYTNNYLYMLEKAISNNIPLDKKIAFILQNINCYTDTSKMKYVERKNYYVSFILKFINLKERNKIKFIDSYQMGIGPKEYKLFIVVNISSNNNIIFYYDNKTNKFKQITLSEIASMINDGLVLLENIQGLRKYLQKDKVKTIGTISLAK